LENSEYRFLHKYTIKLGEEIEIKYKHILGKGKLIEEDIREAFISYAVALSNEITLLLQNAHAEFRSMLEELRRS
jgi:hypothetical protein